MTSVHSNDEFWEANNDFASDSELNQEIQAFSRLIPNVSPSEESIVLPKAASQKKSFENNAFTQDHEFQSNSNNSRVSLLWKDRLQSVEERKSTFFSQVEDTSITQFQGNTKKSDNVFQKLSAGVIKNREITYLNHSVLSDASKCNESVRHSTFTSRKDEVVTDRSSKTPCVSHETVTSGPQPRKIDEEINPSMFPEIDLRRHDSGGKAITKLVAMTGNGDQEIITQPVSKPELSPKLDPGVENPSVVSRNAPMTQCIADKGGRQFQKRHELRVVQQERMYGKNDRNSDRTDQGSVHKNGSSESSDNECQVFGINVSDGGLPVESRVPNCGTQITGAGYSGQDSPFDVSLTEGLGKEASKLEGNDVHEGLKGREENEQNEVETKKQKRSGKKRAWLKSLVMLKSNKPSQEALGVHRNSGSNDSNFVQAGNRNGSNFESFSHDDKEEKAKKPPKAALTKGRGGGGEEGSKVKVSAHNKSVKEFSDLRLVQSIQGHEGPILSAKFSVDGLYLATAGSDRAVRVWEVQQLRATAQQSTSLNPANEDSVMKYENSLTTLPLTQLLTRAVKGHGRAMDGFRVESGSGSVSQSSDEWSKEYGEERHSGKASGHGVDGSGARTCSSEFGQEECVDGRFPAACTSKATICLRSEAVGVFWGHNGEVLDVSWSKAKSFHFLLSASLDKTVRLWHVQHNSCLRVFEHSSYVTCVDFSPADDQTFVSGSLDEKVRLWNTAQQAVQDWAEIHDIVTAVRFHNDGMGLCVGSYNGFCHIFKVDGSRLVETSSMQVTSSSGTYAAVKRITGIQVSPDNLSKYLITSDDSRIRLFSGDSLQCKYKGHKSSHAQMNASFDETGHFIICASEDAAVYVWNTVTPDVSSFYGTFRKPQSYEYFESDNVRTAVFWPGSTKQWMLCHTKSTCGDSANIVAGAEMDPVLSVQPQLRKDSTERQGHVYKKIMKNKQKPEMKHEISKGMDFLSFETKGRYSTGQQAGSHNITKGNVTAAALEAVIVAAGNDGVIKVYQNIGEPFLLV